MAEKMREIHVPGQKEPLRVPASLSDDEIVEMIERSVPQAPEGTGAAPTFGEQAQGAIETVAPVAGAVAGGTLGAATGPGTAVLGAGLGGALGQSVAGVTRPLLTPEADHGTLLQQFGSLVEAGAYGVAGEMVGQPAAKIIGKGIEASGRAVQRAMIGGKPAAEAIRAQAAIAPHGTGLSAGQLSGEFRAAADIMEGIAENAILSQNIMSRFRIAQRETISSLAEEIVDKIGSKIGISAVARMVFGEAGKKTGAVLERNREAFRSVSKALYKQVDDLTQGAQVDASEPFTWLAKNAHRQDVQRLIKSAFPDETLIRPETRQMLEMAGMPEGFGKIGFTEAAEYRTRLLRIGRGRPSAPEDVPVVELSKKVAHMMDEAIDGASQVLTPNALQAFRAANEFYKTGQETFNNSLIRAAVRKMQEKPGTLSTTLLQPNNVDTLGAVRKAIGDPAYEQLIQPRLAASLMARATDEATGRISGQKLLTTVHGLGKETVDAALTPGAQQAMKELANAIKVSESRPGGPGRVYIQLAQAGALTELLFSPVESLTGIGTGKPAMVILFGPVMMAKFMTNPATIKMLTQGLHAGPGTPAMARATAQLAVQAASLKREAFTAAEREGVTLGETARESR